MEQAYTKTVEDVSDYFGVDLESGLTDDQIKKSRDRYGPNGKYSSLNLCLFRIFAAENKS